MSITCVHLCIVMSNDLLQDQQFSLSEVTVQSYYWVYVRVDFRRVPATEGCGQLMVSDNNEKGLNNLLWHSEAHLVHSELRVIII